MALSVETVQALAVIQEGTPPFARFGDGTILGASPELTKFLVALTEEVARLERRVKELEERSI